MSDLHSVFQSFCAFGGGKPDEMDNAKFAKFARDSGLLDKKFTSTDIDLIFSKIKAKGERKISYDIFKTQGIPEIAARKGMPEDQLISTILGQGGPHSSGTHADAVRFHDDKESYTGVYAKGGPTTVDLRTSDLSHITNRKDADVRGVQKDTLHSNLPPAREHLGAENQTAEHKQRQQHPTTTHQQSHPNTTTHMTHAPPPPPPQTQERRASSCDGKLLDIYHSFCSFGGGKSDEMDNAKFAKFARDSGLLDKKFTSTDIDLIFSKIKVKGERKISYDIFMNQGIPEIAARKGMPEDQLISTILGQGGPHSSGTHADAVRFHDDKESYTGVYAKGGPTTVDLRTSDLSHITNRKEADVRGVQH